MYATDTAKALCALLTCEMEDGEVVNVGSGKSVIIHEVVQAVAAILRIREPEVIVDPSRLRRREIPSCVCDNRKWRRVTNWSPALTLDKGLRQTVEWYIAHGDAWPYEKSREPPIAGSDALLTPSRLVR